MIDQLATIVAPAVAGFLLVRAGLVATSFIFIVLTGFAWLGEAFSMRAISRLVADINKMPSPSKYKRARSTPMSRRRCDTGL